MNKKCPKCKNYQDVNVIDFTKSENNIDDLGHFRLECKMCGQHFNYWAADREIVKKIFGDSYEIYQ